MTGTTPDLVNASNVDFINHDQYTLFFTGLVHPKTGNPNQTINQVPDDNSPPTSGNIKLRFFHASPCAGDPTCLSPERLDVYVVTPTTDITGLQPNVSALAYQQASIYMSPAAASYEIIVTPAGKKKTTGYPDQTFALSAGQIRTFVMMDISHTSPPPPQPPPPFQISPDMLELPDLN